jgi:hypothetical protein
MGGLSEREARRLIGWGPVTESIAGKVEQTQDIVWRNGDLVIDGGLPTLEQDLAAAFVTGLGRDPLNPGFGFDGFDVISREPDRFILRERLRVAVVNLLKRDPRVDRVDQVLIGRDEIKAARPDEAAAKKDEPEIGLLQIEVAFVLRGSGEQVRFNVGSVVGSG